MNSTNDPWGVGATPHTLHPPRRGFGRWPRRGSRPASFARGRRTWERPGPRAGCRRTRRPQTPAPSVGRSPRSRTWIKASYTVMRSAYGRQPPRPTSLMTCINRPATHSAVDASAQPCAGSRKEQQGRSRTTAAHPVSASPMMGSARVASTMLRPWSRTSPYDSRPASGTPRREAATQKPLMKAMGNPAVLCRTL